MEALRPTAPAVSDDTSKGGLMVTPYSMTFGPFTLHFPQRNLTKDGEAVRLGSRALDILVVLVENAGVLVSTRELCERVWADSVVDEGALRVHLSAVRKALGDGNEGIRYIVNETGRDTGLP